MANILLVGGSHGIGLAMLEQLLAADHHIWLACREPERVPAHAALTAIRWDAEQSSFPADALPAQLHGLAYCPGSITLKPFARLTEADFLHDWQLNVMGAVRALQAARPALQAAGQAQVVLFSSVAAQTGLTFHASIAAAKAAVEGLTRSLAAEWAPAIRINAIAPALIDTPLAAPLLNTDAKRQAIAERNPLKQIGSAKAVADLACWLLTAEHNFATGQIFALDGGLSRLR